MTLPRQLRSAAQGSIPLVKGCSISRPAQGFQPLGSPLPLQMDLQHGSGTIPPIAPKQPGLPRGPLLILDHDPSHFPPTAVRLHEKPDNNDGKSTAPSTIHTRQHQPTAKHSPGVFCICQMEVTAGQIKHCCFDNVNDALAHGIIKQHKLVDLEMHLSAAKFGTRLRELCSQGADVTNLSSFSAPIDNPPPSSGSAKPESNAPLDTGPVARNSPQDSCHATSTEDPPGLGGVNSSSNMTSHEATDSDCVLSQSSSDSGTSVSDSQCSPESEASSTEVLGTLTLTTSSASLLLALKLLCLTVNIPLTVNLSGMWQMKPPCEPDVT